MTYSHTTLPNSLRVVTVPLHDTRAVTVFVFAKVGSRHETRSINGASHFIEHLMFKGTKKRPSTLDLSKLLDGVGANYNAFTSKDWTGYYVKADASHLGLALDVVSDMLQHSLFDPKEIERERGVIVEEIKMYEENPVMAIEDLFESVVFGKHHPLGWNIAGPAKVIKSVSRQSLISYRDRYYHAGNMLVVVAGRLPTDINRRLERFFGKVPRRSRTPIAKPYTAKDAFPIALVKKDLEQVQVGLGTRSYSYTDRRSPALSVLSVILGGNMSSRLFIQVRERRGLAYSVSSSANPYEDTGAFMIHAGLEKSRLDEALRVIVAELKRLKTTRVARPELDRAKEFLRGKMILNIEDSENLASWYGRQGLFAKKIETPDQAMAKIAAVTAADVQRIAKHLFRPSMLRLAVIGPFDDRRHWLPILKQV